MVKNIISQKKMINNSLHKKIITFFKKQPKKGEKKERLWVQKYLGSDKPTRCIKSGETIRFAKELIKKNDLSVKEFTDLIDSLYQNGETFEEMEIAARLLGVSPKVRKQINPQKLNLWLNCVHGWAETDVLCQSSFSGEEVLNNWNVWKKLLIKFSKDKNVHKRRASLVLLTKSVRESDDKKLSELAFKNIDLLKKEKDILITKAISWILRSLIKNHKKEVENYLKKNKETLPKIAVRETTNKLLTGKKNYKPATN
jgi:3-methyladenine DNA glycosylase AlkD